MAAAPAPIGRIISIRVQTLPPGGGTSGGGSSSTSPDGITGAGRRGPRLTIVTVTLGLPPRRSDGAILAIAADDVGCRWHRRHSPQPTRSVRQAIGAPGDRREAKP